MRRPKGPCRHHKLTNASVTKLVSVRTLTASYHSCSGASQPESRQMVNSAPILRRHPVLGGRAPLHVLVMPSRARIAIRQQALRPPTALLTIASGPRVITTEHFPGRELRHSPAQRDEWRQDAGQGSG